jgi:hypothetical protein
MTTSAPASRPRRSITAGGAMMVATSMISCRTWLPSSGRSRQADQATRGCCPFAARGSVPDVDAAGAGASCLVRTHETPGDSRVRAPPSPVCTGWGGGQSRWQKTVMDRSKRPAPEPYVPTTGPTMLHPGPVTFPNLTSANCCPHAAPAEARPWSPKMTSRRSSAPAIVSRTPVRVSGVRSGAALFLLWVLHRALQRD